MSQSVDALFTEENDSPHAGSGASRVQSRRWMFTINNYTTDYYNPPQWIKDFTSGGVWGREVGDSGTPHIQGFMWTKRRYTLGGIRRLFPPGFSMHLEMARGNAQQCIDYCSKDGNFTSWGTLPQDGSVRSERGSSAEEWEQTFQHAVNGLQSLIPAEKRIKHYTTLKLIEADHKKRPRDLDSTAGIWIYGESGYGKSHYARTEFEGSFYVKDYSKWWSGYHGEENVILDDLAPEHSYLSSQLKLWGDKYPFSGEVKGGHTGYIRPTRFIVTSQYSIEEIFFDPKTVDAIRRRFRVIHVTRCRVPGHYRDGVHVEAYHQTEEHDLS